MNDGWKCPGCGRCYAPWMPECTKCGPPKAETPGSPRCGVCGTFIEVWPHVCQMPQSVTA